MMQKVGRALPVVWILLAATTGLLVSGAVGCSYDSGLGGATCDPSQEGDRRDGEVCRGGYWVEDDRDAAQPDAGDADDGGSGDACIPSSEVCNDIDDDCNGRIDEGIDCSCNYLGNDRGACTDAEKDASGECQRPDAYNETEVRCGDGIDNDCDGSVDDTDADCQCSGDATRDCYTGSSETEGVGICVTGEQTCENGRWGRCENEKLPDSGEICGDGRDNDCDGSTDESCDCAYDPNEPKDIDTDGSHDAGICADRSVADSGGCSKPEDFESRTNTESNCDRLDNDCDGAVDEGCECTFDPFENDRTDTDGSHDDGVCTEQTRTTDGLCEAPGTFETKTDAEDRCDSFDNDCDGDTDEGCPCDYDNNTDGVCGGATRDASGMCQQPNEYDSTDAETSPGNCDQLDNDCDGYTDEGCPCDYDNTSRGVCGNATNDSTGTCTKPSNWEPDTDTETRCVGADNDCDGYTDEGCLCDYNNDTDGVCGGATRDATGTCAQPLGYDFPTDTESGCSGTDNDCDGYTDEGCPCNYDNTSNGICGNATNDSTGTCAKPSNWEPDTDTETVCDGADNDCDGYTDEGCPCDYDNTSNGICGSATRDANGMCQQPNDYDSTDAEASAANCDQLDNDCDGYTDERCSCDYTGTPVGVCGTATRDSAGACQEPNDYQSPETDLCDDGIDNDCDGDTDASSKDGGESCNVDCECHSGSCDGGSCRHRVFVTSDQHSPDFGSLSSADTKCDDIASNAGLKGNWRAVLSDSSTDATSRITVDAAVDELDGDEVAGDASDFWSDSHSEDLDIAEDQSNLSNCGDGCDDDHVWTGTTTSGTGQGNYCGDWTSTNSNATAGTGDAGRTNSEWVEETTEPCDKQLHLYCIDGQ